MNLLIFFNGIINKCIEKNIDFHISFDYNHGYISITSDMKEIPFEYDPDFEKFVINHVSKDKEELKNEPESDN